MLYRSTLAHLTPLPLALVDEGEVIVEDDLSSGEWLGAGIIILATIIVAVATNRIARALLSRALGSGFAAILTARVIGYSIFLVGLIYALNSLGVRVGPLLGALGLGGLVLALALQKVVENFMGALILQTRRPFTVGDTVDLDGHVGVVQDIDARTVVLKGLDGSEIRMPNAEVLAHTIINLTRRTYRRSELAVGVAYDTNLERATQVLGEAAERVRRIPDAPAPMVVLRQFGSSSIDFIIYFWHRSDVPSELMATHDLALSVHQALASADITIAFPQLVVWPPHDVDANPYWREPQSVFTEQPQPTEAPTEASGRRRTFLRRRRP